MTEQVVPPTSAVTGTETPNPPEKVAPETVKPDPRMAHLAKKERALRAEQMRLEAERAVFMKEKQEAEGYKSWRDRLAKKDFDALKDIGVTPDELTQYLVNQPNPTDRRLQELQAKIEQLESGQTQTQKQMEEATQKQYDQAVLQISNEVKHIVAGEPDKYELIAANEAGDAVVELIKKTFDSEGRMMSIEEACNEVEEYLLDESVKLMSLKKVKGKLTPEPVQPQFIDTPKDKKSSFAVASSERQPPKTLTHQHIPLPTSKPTSDKERRQRAIMAFQGQLNK